MTTIVRFTTAPEDYDGFGTVSEGVRGIVCGKPVRRVRIRPGALQWQESRYASGMHASVTAEEFRRSVRAGLTDRVKRQA